MKIITLCIYYLTCFQHLICNQLLCHRSAHKIWHITMHHTSFKHCYECRCNRHNSSLNSVQLVLDVLSSVDKVYKTMCVRTLATIIQPVAMQRYTGRSKSYATPIKIFTDGCNSLQFDWINKHKTSQWQCESPNRLHHAVKCSHQCVSCLSKGEVQGRISDKSNECLLSNTAWLLIRSYLTCQKVFRDTLPNSPAPNKSTYRPVTTETLHWVASDTRRRVNASRGDFQHLP
jgi:hypothetical protein